jgi:hypothetical protein
VDWSTRVQLYLSSVTGQNKHEVRMPYQAGKIQGAEMTPKRAGQSLQDSDKML